MTIKRFALVSMIVIVSTFAAEAQEPARPNGPPSTPRKRFSDRDLGPGAYGRPSGYTTLLKNPLVLEEIHLTDEQKEKLKEVEQQQTEFFRRHDDERRNRMDEFYEQNKMNDPARRTIQNMNEFNQLQQTISIAGNQVSAEFDAKIARNILNRRQATRLKEIHFQAMGMSYFLTPEARETLALEPDQADAFSKLLFDYNEQKRVMTAIPANATKLAEGATPTSESKLYDQSLESARKNAIKLHATTMKAIEQVLTKPQRGAYKKLVGEPFDFDKPKEIPTEKEQVEKAKQDEPKSN